MTFQSSQPEPTISEATIEASAPPVPLPLPASTSMLNRHHHLAFLQQQYLCSWAMKPGDAQTVQSTDLLNAHAQATAAKINAVLENAGCTERAKLIAKKKISNLPIPAEQAETGYSRIEMSGDTCQSLVQALSEQETQRAATFTGRLSNALRSFASSRPRDNLDYARKQSDMYRY